MKYQDVPMNIIGVYLITCKINRFNYIGGSASNSGGIRKRIHGHLTDLKLGKHSSKLMQRDWDKYGADNFEFILLEECPIHLVKSTEQKYLDILGVGKENKSYNSCPDAKNNTGLKQTVERIFKIKEAKAKWYVMYPPVSTPILIKDLKPFCDKNDLNSNVMFGVCIGKHPSHKSWKARYATPEEIETQNILDIQLESNEIHWDNKEKSWKVLVFETTRKSKLVGYFNNLEEATLMYKKEKQS